MKTIKAIHIIAVAISLCLLPSCKLIGSVAKIPVGIVKSVGRTVGISNLTDHPSEPVKREAADQQVADQIHTGQGSE